MDSKLAGKAGYLASRMTKLVKPFLETLNGAPPEIGKTAYYVTSLLRAISDPLVGRGALYFETLKKSCARRQFGEKYLPSVENEQNELYAIDEILTELKRWANSSVFHITTEVLPYLEANKVQSDITNTFREAAQLVKELLSTTRIASWQRHDLWGPRNP
jgi:hypothetical protein